MTTLVMEKEFLLLDLKDETQPGKTFLRENLKEQEMDRALDTLLLEKSASIAKDWWKKAFHQDILNFPEEKKTLVCVAKIQDLKKKSRPEVSPW